MLEQVKKPERFAEGGMPTADPEQTESRSMLERLSRFISLDTPQDMSLGATAADIALGFAPGIGTAQGIRDFERARRDDDMLGMALAGLSAIPVAGGIIKAGRGIGRAAEGALDMSQTSKAPAKVNVSETGIIKGGADRMMSQLPGRNVLNLWIEKGDEAIESGWNTTGDPVVVLDKIVIDPDLRQQGYGRRVLEQAIKDASEALPDGELKLLAEPLGGKDGIDSYDLVKFYESLGFSVDDYQQGMSGVPMSLMLPVVGGEVSSARRMLEQVKKPERFAEGGMPTADPKQTESRSMLERLQRFTSLDTPQDMTLGETAADIGMGFLPGVGTAQGARDFERSRREGDWLGMALGAASMIPVVGGAVRAARKAANVAEEIPSAARQMLDTMPQAATPRVPAVGTPVSVGGLRQAGVSPQELTQIDQSFRMHQSGVQSVDELVTTAARVDPVFQGSVRDVANSIGGAYVQGPPKTAESISDKLVRKGGTAAGIPDPIRATVLVENNAQAEEAVRQLAGRYPVIDEGWQRIPANGYIDRKLAIQFTGPNGERLLGEIQINTPPMQTVKDSVGHTLYETERGLIQRYGSPMQMPPSELMRYRDAIQEQSRVYGEATSRIDPSILEQVADKRARGGYIGRLGRP
jgi:GNAT superfamily N-acetyltransferase